MKTFAWIVAVCVALVAGLVGGLAIGRAKAVSWKYEGERVEFRKSDSEVSLVNDMKVVAELRPYSNGYILIAYGAGVPVVSMKFEKWKENPVLVQRIVIHPEESIVLTYGRDGHVESETSVAR